MNSSRLSYLDNVWSSGGTLRLKGIFNDLVQRDRAQALRQVNDARLSFPVLFVLMPEISAHNMITGLSRRDMTAITICARKIYKHETEIAATDADTMYQTLKWMFDTGKDWGGPSDGRDPYDSVIDYAASILIITYDDREVLKDVADLIFRRNRQGLFIHDLVWSFFQSLDRDALAVVAGHLLSENPRDTALACRLLCLNESAASNTDELRKVHRQFRDWLDENKPYLYLTGEHFQMTTNPKHVDTDVEAKYLGKEISPRYRVPLERLTADERECLHKFREATPEEQTLLTSYSHKLRRRDNQMWYEWIHKQTAEQVIAARTTYEVI